MDIFDVDALAEGVGICRVGILSAAIMMLRGGEKESGR
jgi:hypothetical protein